MLLSGLLDNKNQKMLEVKFLPETGENVVTSKLRFCNLCKCIQRVVAFILILQDSFFGL